MIDPDTRNAVYQLHRAGMTLRNISHQFRISRNTVRAIIAQQGAMPDTVRKDKIEIDPELLARLYKECHGRIQRVHEKLIEEQNIQIGYATLTRMLRELGVSQTPQQRCDRVPDEPGAEMQHDTTVYRVQIAGKPTRLIASLVYLRYSKRRYLKFYRSFNRFAMKCFLHEALMFWSHAPRRCIIDNTNLARLHGTGSRAVIVPEMVSFAERYGFQFRCHALRHPNRKAGNERGFWSVETNFLPGRNFDTLEDLNEQAHHWATVRMDHRAMKRSGLIPLKAFEHERDYLTELPAQLPAPYLAHERGTDQYGYVAFAGNYYWVPGTKREDVKLLQYAERVKIFLHRSCVAEYTLPPDGTKNERFSPEGQPQPRHMPKNRRGGSESEEKRLRAMGAEVGAYLDYALRSLGIQRHRYLRELFALSRQLTAAVFIQTLQRALRYRVLHIESLHRIAWFCMSQRNGTPPDSEVEVDENFRERPAYQEGYLTDEPDLSIYDESNDDETEPSAGEDDDDDE